MPTINKPACTWKGSPNFDAQTGVRPLFYVIHWMVGNLNGTDSVFSRSSYEVATNYGIENDRLHQYVADDDYAWGTGDYYANRYGVSAEHAGGWVMGRYTDWLGQGVTRYTPTKRTHETSAQLLAWLSVMYGWGKLVLGKNVFGHKDFTSTTCPGSTGMQWIVDRANQILGSGSGPSKPSKPASTSSSSQRGEHRRTATEEDGLRGPIFIGRVQTLGMERGLYPKSYNIDGVTGPATEKARVKLTAQALNGWVWGPHTTSDRDGIPGRNYWTAVQETGRKRFGYPSGAAIDGVPGPETRKAENKITAHELNAHR